MQKLLFFLLLCPGISVAKAQQTQPILLYPNGVPNAKETPAYKEITANDHVSKVTEPAIIPFFPLKDSANGTAVIICPGGGYANLAINKEGYEVAKAFNRAGITAFVLKYRLPSDSIMVDKSIGPLQDAQAAIKLVRMRAAEWNIDANKIGIMGFSAGGHLASTAGTHFDTALIENKEGTSLRPDFMLLLYPVISFGEWAHKGSRENLIGKNATQAQNDHFSNEKQVTATTPPTFLVHAGDDRTVPVQNALMFYEALLKAGVKAEMHILQSGGHGFGLHNKTTKEDWLELCKNWMESNGFITATPSTK